MRTIRKPRKGDSDYTLMPPQAEDHMRPSLACSLRLLAPALLVMLSGCGGGSSSTAVNPPPGGPPALALSAFASGLASPTGMEVPNDGTGRLFVLEQGGRIRIIQNGALVATPFLDITFKVESGGEKGTARARISPQLQLESPLLSVLHAASELAAPVGVLRICGLQFESKPSRRFQRTRPVSGQPAF
jgi:glucose/arabinose dehydrogenase